MLSGYFTLFVHDAEKKAQSEGECQSTEQDLHTCRGRNCKIIATPRQNIKNISQNNEKYLNFD